MFTCQQSFPSHAIIHAPSRAQVGHFVIKSPRIVEYEPSKLPAMKTLRCQACLGFDNAREEYATSIHGMPKTNLGHNETQPLTTVAIV
jgi:hypothetical protein